MDIFISFEVFELACVALEYRIKTAINNRDNPPDYIRNINGDGVREEYAQQEQQIVGMYTSSLAELERTFREKKGYDRARVLLDR